MFFEFDFEHIVFSISGKFASLSYTCTFLAQVQADVVSVLLERMDIITLDVFSCLLPVLVGLLDSKVER